MDKILAAIGDICGGNKKFCVVMDTLVDQDEAARAVKPLENSRCMATKQ